MPRGSSVTGAMNERVAKFNRHQVRHMLPKKRARLPPPAYVPKNRNERRALAALQRGVK